MRRKTQPVRTDVRRTVFFFLALALALTAFAITVFYTLDGAVKEMHADCTDTLYWAEASRSSGKLVSDNFYYSALLPFGGELLMLLPLEIFGFSLAAHLAGMAVFVVLFAASFLFFFRSAEWSWTRTFFSVSVALLFFTLSMKMREILYGHIFYYSLSILFLCLLGGLLLRILRAEQGKKRIVWFVLLALLCFGIGVDGPQMLSISVIPVLGAVVIELLLGKRSMKSPEARPLRIAGYSLLGGSLLGFLFLQVISHGVKAGYAEGYSTYDTMSNWTENLMEFPQQLFSLLGVEVRGRESLFSGESVGIGLRILIALVLLTVPLLMLIRYRRLRSDGSRILLWIYLAVSAVTLYGFVFGRLNNANWRLIPMVGTALLCTLAAIRELHDGGMISRRFSYAGIAFLIAVSLLAAIGMVPLLTAEPNSASLDEARAYLDEQGLQYGYADYWQSQLLSVLDGPERKVLPVEVDNTGELSRRYYQTEINWSDALPDSDRYFLLLTENSYASYYRSDSFTDKMEYWIDTEEAGRYVILVFSEKPIDP